MRTIIFLLCALPLMSAVIDGVAGLSINDTGDMKFNDVAVEMVISETGNVPTMQNAASVKRDPGYPKTDASSFAINGIITAGRSKKQYPFTQTVTRSAAGIELSYTIDDLADDIIDVRLSFKMPLAVAKGRAVTADGKMVPLPIEADEFTIMNDVSMKSIALPAMGGDILVTGSFIGFLQDRRKSKQDWYETRLQFIREGTSARFRAIVSAIPEGAAAQAQVKPSFERFSKIAVEKNVAYLAPERAEKIDIYMPEAGDERFPAVLVIHGGGWSGGDKADKRETQICDTLARAGFVAASVNYLLSAKNAPSWPTNIHDVKSAIRFLRVNAAKYHIDPAHIGTIGGSAGGHLAMLMALTGDDERLDPPLYPGTSTKIAAAVNLYGVPDIRKPLSKSTRGCGEGWIGKRAEDETSLFELLSPITHVKKDSAPVFTLHGTKDVTVPIAYSEELIAVMKARGAPYQYTVVNDAPHTFYINSKSGDFREVIVEFFRKYLR
ncbi:MAG: alpha/beta hydrolase [Spirochaetota bacterium]|mgnify:CR=1 FL=1